MAIAEREWHINDVDEGLVDESGQSVKTRYVTIVGYGDPDEFITLCAAGTKCTIAHGGADGYILSVNYIDSFSTANEVTYTAVCFPGLIISREDTFKKNIQLYQVTIQINKSLGGGGSCALTVPMSGWYPGGKKTIKNKNGKTIFVGYMYSMTQWTTKQPDENGDIISIPWTKATFVDKVYDISRSYICKRMFFPGAGGTDFTKPPKIDDGVVSCTYADIAVACFAAAGVLLVTPPASTTPFDSGVGNSKVWTTCADWNPHPLSDVVQFLTADTGYYIYADENNDLHFTKPTIGSGSPGGTNCLETSESYSGALDLKSVACYMRGESWIVGSGVPMGIMVRNHAAATRALVTAEANLKLANAAENATSTTIRGTLDSVNIVQSCRAYSISASFLVSLTGAAEYIDEPITLAGTGYDDVVEMIL
jgi:hypothetical protein